jgi:hypothetical protein
MTNYTPEKVADLSAEARSRTYPPSRPAMLVARLADALEAVSAEVERLHAVMGRGFIKVLSDRDEAYREMHARELHHFEEEQARAKAEAERDEALAAIAELARIAKRCIPVAEVDRILSRIPEHPKED